MILGNLALYCETNTRAACIDCSCYVFQVFITNGILADVVIVVAITDPTDRSKAQGITLFLVEDGMPGT